jgi:hypothetical protein
MSSDNFLTNQSPDKSKLRDCRGMTIYIIYIVSRWDYNGVLDKSGGLPTPQNL